MGTLAAHNHRGRWPEVHAPVVATLPAWYKVPLKTRPQAEPTYGSCGERFRGTATTTFIHNQRGNP